MWNVIPSGRWDWPASKEMVARHGVRNSLLVAPMPTASTSQILGNNECFEPYTSNIYARRVLSGEFVVVNKHLLNDLTDLGIWTPDLNIQVGLTVWEIKQVDMAVERGAYIDQSQSLNIHMEQPTTTKLTSLHFHAWSGGLKTGMYYLRSQAAADAIKFTVDTASLKVGLFSTVLSSHLFCTRVLQSQPTEELLAQMVFSLENRENCLACGS
ncbi:hypothetical protein SELMODRAFT_109248 [Selaginella moellendorffii]|uniref:Ribonucleotide reductase large subunit C-terminal domain-containing protein n=1 Tax=Selaginella moellendorffii TaxID=88036 RepID=D8S629_SELML|nr:hypothetical protein SELMODRAFT_109248 [Selaginella moellendorffii]